MTFIKQFQNALMDKLSILKDEGIVKSIEIWNGPGWDRAEIDDVEVAVDIYQGDDTYIVYDEDGDQHCFVYDEE